MALFSPEGILSISHVNIFYKISKISDIIFGTMLYYDVGLIIGYKQFSIKSETSDARRLVMSTCISFIYFKHKLVFSKILC